MIFKSPQTNDDGSTKYLYAFVDLDGDGLDESYCLCYRSGVVGERRLTTLILAPQGSWFQVVAKITITHPMIPAPLQQSA